MKIIANTLEILLDGGYRNFTETEIKFALEKQIPKKPLDISKLYNGDYGYCPCCNRVVSDYKEMKVCSGCGQALDWSDTK